MYKHILVPVGAISPDAANEALAVAKKLLAKGGKITISHVMEPVPGYALSSIPADITKKNMQAMEEGMKAIAEAGGKQVEYDISHGHPGRQIVDKVHSDDVDCIVIKSHMPGMEDYLFGSTAAWVVRHAKCAVHVVR